MEQKEAELIAKALDAMTPPHIKVVPNEIPGKAGKAARWNVVGSDGFRIDYSWQYTEMLLYQIIGALQQHAKPQILTASGLPPGLVRG